MKNKENNNEADEFNNYNEYYSEKTKLNSGVTNIFNKKDNNKNKLSRISVIYITVIIYIIIFIIFILYFRKKNKTIKFKNNEINEIKNNSIIKNYIQNNKSINNNISNYIETIISFNINNISNISNINKLNNIPNIKNTNILFKIKNVSLNTNINKLNKKINLTKTNITNVNISFKIYNISNNTNTNKLNNNINISNIQYFKNIINEFKYIDEKTNKTFIIKTEKDFLKICEGRNESQKADIYFKLCEKGFLFDKTINKRPEKPKISIILIIYNRDRYIQRILRSIQNQPMKDIEIIFVDDCSRDKSVNIIEYHQKYDERIILLKHSTNLGTLNSRKEGIYEAEGEYIMFVDSDDLMLYDILNKSYKLAKKGNYEIVQFGVLRMNYKGYFWNYGEIRNTTPIYQPELSNLMYYYRGYLKQTDWHIWGKLIKKESLYKALDSINKYYFDMKMSINEDGVIDFALLKKAKSFIYMKDYGYIYVINTRSIVYTMKYRMNKTLRDYILYLKFLFENTGNNWHEKSMAGEQLRTVYFKLARYIYVVSNDFDLAYDTLNLYLKSKFIKKINKRRAKQMKDILENSERKLKKGKNITKKGK